MVMDGTATQVDVTLNAGETGTSLEDQIKAAELRGKSDALADVNRTMAEAKKAIAYAEAAEKRVDQMLKDYEEDIKDDPDKLTTFRERQAKQKADADLARMTLELNEAKEKLTAVEAEKKQTALEKTVREVAARLTVDTNTLLELAKLTDGKSEAIEDIAKKLPKTTPLKPGLRPDSSRSIGGGQSEEQIRENYRTNPNDPQVRADYLAWRRAKGI